MPAREALEIATLGGASVLGRTDIGSQEVGKAADFFAVSLDRLEFAGARHDPVAALVLCAPVTVDETWVAGKPVVRQGRLTTLDTGELISRHNRVAAELLR